MVYKFPAMRGMQAKSEYYVCMIPLGVLAKIFADDSSDALPEFRAQRKLNEIRIPEIRDYILNNRNSYVFSALAASVDGNIRFLAVPLSSNIGELEIDMDAVFLINDGQHRKAAIIKAVAIDETLKNETIAVVLYKDRGLERSQQMFTDLNKHAVNASKSLNTLYDSKDPLALLTKQLVNEIPFFCKYTDKEKDNPAKYAAKFFTLNMFYDANQRIIKSPENSKDELEFLVAFWGNVVRYMRDWNDMDNGNLSKKDLRELYISTQGVTIHAFGKLGHYLYCHKEIDMEKGLQGLTAVDWMRSNLNCWKNRAITGTGRINRNEKGIFLTYVQIKRLLGLKIEKDESAKENQIL
ncbi:MAG: DNA sulfur modification protein DndB [Christensenellaceae bacterium]